MHRQLGENSWCGTSIVGARWSLLAIGLVACSALPPPFTTLPSPNATPSPPVPPAPTQLTIPPPQPLGLALAWRFATLETVWDLVAADLEGDSRPEIIVASQDKGIYALNIDGSQRWRFPAQAGVYTLAAGDLDGDSSDEVIAGSDDNFVYALDDGGRLIWSHQTDSRVTQVAVDRGQGGAGLVVASSWDGSLYLFDAVGNLIRRIAIDSAAASLELADLEGDQAAEILAGTEDGYLGAWDADGDQLWEQRIPGYLRALEVSPSQRILVGSSQGLVEAIHPSGLSLWSRELTTVLEARWGNAEEALACCVLRSELPHLELVRLSAFGSMTPWSYHPQAATWALRVIDVESDGVLEIVAGDDAGWVSVLDEFGRSRGRYRTHARVHNLVVTDLNGDGSSEIVASSGSEVYALRLTSPGEGERGVPAPTPPATIDRASSELLPPAPPGTVELLAIGDLFFCRTIEERMNLLGADYPLAATAELIRAADLSIGNLECPLTTRGAPVNKRFIFRAHPRLATALSSAGFDLVSVANNHILDFGRPALEDIIANLNRQGIPYVGAGLSEADAHRPVVLEVGGLRFAFLAYAAIRWLGSQEVPTRTLVSFAEVPRIREEVARAKEAADFVIVLMHLGTEYQSTPDAEQVAAARAAIESGASLVIGHHPHVLQEPEIYGGGLIAYSLGNFVFDIDVLDRARDAAILRAFFDREGLVRADWIPVRIVDDVQPRLLLGEEGQPIVRQVYP